MFDSNDKNDTKLTDTKSTKLDAERSKREDANKWFGMKAEFKQDGLCYFEDGRIIDPNQEISDAVL